MACGCPVITCRNSSLTEVAGDAAIYVDEYDVTEMLQALEQVQRIKIRQRLIEEGFKQAKKLSWNKMANEIIQLFLNTIEDLRQKRTINNNSNLLWQELRKEQIHIQKIIDTQSIQEASYCEEISNLKKFIDTQSIQEVCYLKQITNFHDESASLQAKLELAHNKIEAMKTSKFWKIRSLWFKLKETNQKNSAPRGGVWKSFARKPLVSIASLYFFAPRGGELYPY